MRRMLADQIAAGITRLYRFHDNNKINPWEADNWIDNPLFLDFVAQNRLVEKCAADLRSAQDGPTVETTLSECLGRLAVNHSNPIRHPGGWEHQTKEEAK